MIQRLLDRQPWFCSVTREASSMRLHTRDLASSYTVLAMFPSRHTTQSSPLHHGSPKTHFNSELVPDKERSWDCEKTSL